MGRLLILLYNSLHITSNFFFTNCCSGSGTKTATVGAGSTQNEVGMIPRQEIVTILLNLYSRIPKGLMGGTVLLLRLAKSG